MDNNPLTDLLYVRTDNMTFVSVDSVLDWLTKEADGNEMCDGAQSLWDEMRALMETLKHQTEVLPN